MPAIQKIFCAIEQNPKVAFRVKFADMFTNSRHVKAKNNQREVDVRSALVVDCGSSLHKNKLMIEP